MKTKISIILICLPIFLFGRQYNILDYGAINDGQTLNTIAIQKAIDKCTSLGGGTVMIDGGGTYVSGTIHIKDNVALHVTGGMTLQGSPNYSDYKTDTYKMMYQFSTHMDRCFIFASNAKNIVIEGYGIIDGNGHQENFPKKPGCERPMLIRFVACENIYLQNINLINPASWTSVFLYCDTKYMTKICIYRYNHERRHLKEQMQCKLIHV